uniref:Uncharacterized protein n=1 Tax=Anguilla anguilla TaxID=7936 RepID=A0A0E9USZ8_ANGAN
MLLQPLIRWAYERTCSVGSTLAVSRNHQLSNREQSNRSLKAET